MTNTKYIAAQGKHIHHACTFTVYHCAKLRSSSQYAGRFLEDDYGEQTANNCHAHQML